MTENYILLAEDCLSWRLPLLHCEQGHLLECGFKDCGLPEVSSLPDLKLVDLRKQVDELFDLLIDKIEGKEQAKKSSDDEDVVLLLALLEDCLDDPPAYLCVVGRLDDDLMLQPVLLDEDEGDKAVEMVFAEIRLERSNFAVDSFNIDLLAVPKQGYGAGYLHEVLVDCLVVGPFLLLLVGSEEVRGLHDLETGNSFFELLLP